MGLADVMAHGLLEVDDLQICQSTMSNFSHAFDSNGCDYRAYQNRPGPFRWVVELPLDAPNYSEGCGAVCCCQVDLRQTRGTLAAGSSPDHVQIDSPRVFRNSRKMPWIASVVDLAAKQQAV